MMTSAGLKVRTEYFNEFADGEYVYTTGVDCPQAIHIFPSTYINLLYLREWFLFLAKEGHHLSVRFLKISCLFGCARSSSRHVGSLAGAGGILVPGTRD